MKKSTSMYLILVVIIIGIILTINYIRANGNSDEKTIKCIADKSLLIVKKGCSACAYQKGLLGDYIDNFHMIDAADKPEVIEEYSLNGVPTWVINNEVYSGVQSIEKLKELTGC